MSNDNLPQPAFTAIFDGEIFHVKRGDYYTADQVRQCMRDAVAASGAGVPAGYALVPIEPTNEMARMGGHINSEYLNDSAPLGESRYKLPIASIWKAMLAAAPTPDRATKAEAPAQGELADTGDTNMNEAQWEAHKAKLAAKYPGIAAGYAVVEVLIETESGCNIEAGEWGFSIPRILHGAIKSDDLSVIEDCLAEDIGDLNLPVEGITSFIVYESGEWQDVFWTKFYRLAAVQAQAGDAT